MRLLRSIGLLTVGAAAGFGAAAAVGKRVLPSRGGADSDELELVAIFDGIKLESRAGAFRGGSMLAWYGGIDADLREATMAPEGATLVVHALLGGVAIRVPTGWRVESALAAYAGGVAARGSEDDSAPTLRVEGFALCGGIAIGPRRGTSGDA